MDTPKLIGTLICRLREEQGLSQEQLGKIIGVSGGAISRWENGQGLTMANLDLVLRACNVPAGAFGRLLSLESERSEVTGAKKPVFATTPGDVREARPGAPQIGELRAVIGIVRRELQTLAELLGDYETKLSPRPEA